MRSAASAPSIYRPRSVRWSSHPSTWWNIGELSINMVTCGGRPPFRWSCRVEDCRGGVRGDRGDRRVGVGWAGHPPEHRRVHPYHVANGGRGHRLGIRKGKAIIVLNPAGPPIFMVDTISFLVSLRRGTDHEKVDRSIKQMVESVQRYAPGYRLRAEPQFDEVSGAPEKRGSRVAIFLEIEGAGDYLPSFAGNLDIMTAAAVRVGDEDQPRYMTGVSRWLIPNPSTCGVTGHVPARWPAREASSVLQSTRSSASSMPRRRCRRPGDRGHARGWPGRELVQLRVLAHRRAHADESSGGGRDECPHRRAHAPRGRHQGRYCRRQRIWAYRSAWIAIPLH